MLRPFGLFALKDFKIIWLSDHLKSSVSDEGMRTKLDIYF